MRLLIYILVCAFLFAVLDWKVVHYTRLANRDWLDWMHAHERQYALITRSVELVVCAPALALKPLFYVAALSSEASQEEQESVLHAPKPDLSGFYHLPVRGQSWTFVSWVWWALYWTPISLIWWRFARQIVVRTILK
jgi:hypothetical protein